jgi:hypothetical protein
MNEAYENKRRELIQSMDVSASQTMFEMHQAMCAEWATALNDEIDNFAKMGNNGVGLFTQVASQLNDFITAKEDYFKQNFGSFESATSSSATFMGAMLRSFGETKNPEEFEAQGVKDSKTQSDYESALKAVNVGYRFGSLTIEPDGVFVVFRGLPSNIQEIQDLETPFAPKLVELPVITGDEFAKEKAPQSAMKDKESLSAWMQGQLDSNESAINNAVRSYISAQESAGKKLSKEEIMADKQHMEAVKELYIQQATAAINPSIPTPAKTIEGSEVPLEDEEATSVSFAGGGKFEFNMKDGSKVPAQIFRELKDMEGPSKNIFSRFEARYGSGSVRKLGFALGKAK